MKEKHIQDFATFTERIKQTRAVKEKEELSAKQEEYGNFFRDMLKKYNVSSPAELSEEKKKEFFNEINKGWDGSVTKAGKEALNEGAMSEIHRLAKLAKDENDFIKKVKASDEEELNINFTKDVVAMLKALYHDTVNEGNAFGAARAEAIAKGEKTFKVGDEEYPVEKVDDEDKENAKEFTGEGNAFGAARAEAIAKGKKTFKVGDEEYPVEKVDGEDKENAEEFVKK